MELPPWLKVENLIGNLNLAGWFKGWFNSEKVNIIKNYNIQVNLPKADEKARIIKEGEIPLQTIDIEGKVQEFEFTAEQKIIISKVNSIHAICGELKFNFENDYRLALKHIKDKLSPEDWHCTVSIHIAQAMQDIDFFSAFQEIKDPKEIEAFNGLKGQINSLYRLIQDMRHTDKKGLVKKQFRTAYHNNLGKEPDITDSNHEEIFNDFQLKLLELFTRFKLKTS